MKFNIFIYNCIGAQYVFRYRKYQLAENMGEPDSPAHTPRASIGSMPIGQITSRASSTTTLLSEVASLIKLRPRVGGRKLKHSRLRESIDGEALENGDLCGSNGDGADDCAGDESGGGGSGEVHDYNLKSQRYDPLNNNVLKI